jgi:hypothetical protein
MLSFTPAPQSESFDWDPSQFTLKPDGTFRTSIRCMAAMAGVDQSSFGRSLKSAEAENQLPCARYLLAQGFCPEAVSSWGETGGVPEAAVPFILEHYSSAKSHAGDSEAANGKARRARLLLLSFARVGVNAVLREKLGLPPLSQVRDTRPPALPEASPYMKAAEDIGQMYDILKARCPELICDRWKLELKRDMKVLMTATLQGTAGMIAGASNVLSPAERLPRFLGKAVDPECPLTVVEWAAAYLDAGVAGIVNKYDRSVGTRTHKHYQDRHNEEAPQTNHLSTKQEEARRRRGLSLFGIAKTGFACTPRMYAPPDWDLIVRALRELGHITPDKAAEFMAECQQFRQGMDF